VSGTVTSLEFLLLAVTSVLAIMNPVSTAAVYSVLTETSGKADRKKIINSAMKISFVVLVFFALTGQFIFQILGLTIPAFKIAGGLLLVSVAMGMLSPKLNEYSPDELENISIVPLSFPLTCGAGTITTVILLMSEATGIFQSLFVILSIVIAIGISYLMMTYSTVIFGFIGKHEQRIIPKLMAVFVLAIAIQFIINGISEAMPQILSHIPGITVI
jgi:multiple antibiotic resistance protein